PEAQPIVRGDGIKFPAGNPALQRFAVDRVQPPNERELVMPGRVVWNEERTARVFAPFAGRVSRMLANAGDRVKAGAPLAELASPDFAQAEADARKAQADLALAEQALERVRDLNAHGVAAAKDLQQAEADHARARAEADRALARVHAQGNTVAGEGRFVLRSPIAGTIVERNLNPGLELRPDQPGAPLFVVSDPTDLWVSLDANEADARELRPGMLLVLSSNQFPEENFAGEIRQVADFVDPTARTVKVRGVVKNRDRVLKAEMFVSGRVRLPRGTSPTVSARAVMLDGARRFVFVRNAEGAFVKRAVRVGPESDGRMTAYAGLQEGDEVVVAGNLYLQQMLASARAADDTVAKK
ncbi:MAG: efflux RND transporter periplasmic adaptor subunit, partial [Bacillota bacterium]